MPIFFYHLDCDPSGELSTQKPAYLTSHDTEDKSQLQLPQLLCFKNEPLDFSIKKPPGSICYSFVIENSETFNSPICIFIQPSHLLFYLAANEGQGERNQKSFS